MPVKAITLSSRKQDGWRATPRGRGNQDERARRDGFAEEAGGKVLAEKLTRGGEATERSALRATGWSYSSMRQRCDSVRKMIAPLVMAGDARARSARSFVARSSYVLPARMT
jgi:hypothetical protein